MYPIRLLVALLALSSAAMAETEELQVLSEPPPPPPLESGEAMEPEVTIIQKQEATIEEYRINGELYMIKVTPTVGPSYYLAPPNSDGSWQPDMSSIYSDYVIPRWVIFRW